VRVCGTVKEYLHSFLIFRDEAQTALFKDPVRTALNQSVYAVSGTSRCLFSDKPLKDEARTALFEDPVRTAL